jgi:hypothetical protein
MLYSKTHNFIFVHIPKTGGTSIRRVLEPYATPLPDGTSVDDCTHRYGHLTAIELKRLLGEEVWESCFKFAVVRNPADWYVSLHCFNSGEPLAKDSPETIESFRTLMKARHWDLQLSDYICSEDGELLVDHLIRFDSIKKNFSKVCKQLGIKNTLTHRLPTSRKHYTEFYDRETQRAYEQHYGSDALKYGYQFRPSLQSRIQWFWTHQFPEWRMNLRLRQRLCPWMKPKR